ncbi:hypothetical protein Bbelb_168900 [Branchiostoma belcheri]|nr:hypothetical protein Bbelb_168900 [Branchiostoma belcheri]
MEGIVDDELEKEEKRKKKAMQPGQSHHYLFSCNNTPKNCPTYPVRTSLTDSLTVSRLSEHLVYSVGNFSPAPCVSKHAPGRRSFVPPGDTVDRAILGTHPPVSFGCLGSPGGLSSRGFLRSSFALPTVLDSIKRPFNTTTAASADGVACDPRLPRAVGRPRVQQRIGQLGMPKRERKC